MGKLFDVIKYTDDTSGLMWQLVEASDDMLLDGIMGEAVKIQFKADKLIIFEQESSSEVYRDLSPVHRITYFGKYLVVQDRESYAIFEPVVYVKTNDNGSVLRAMGLGENEHKSSVMRALDQIERQQYDY